MLHRYLVFHGDMVSDARRPKRGPIPMREAVNGRWKNGDPVTGSDVYDICRVLNKDDPMKHVRPIWDRGENRE